MKIGIISFAHMHAFSYTHSLKQIDDVELVGIFDEDAARGQKYADQFETKFFASSDELISQVDAVVVCTENNKHKQYVLAAAKAGKHVLCEKPIAPNKADAEEMIQACKENGVLLQTAFPVRFATSIQRAKQMIEEGKLGKILAIRGTNRGQNPGGWFIDPAQSGGGAVIDHTVHVTDIMRWFLGSEVKEVYAEVGHFISETPIDDCGILTISFENGVFATLDCSWSRNKTFPTWGDVTLEIVGTEGTLSLDAFAQKVDVYTNENGLKWDFWGDDMDAGLIQDFCNSVREGRKEAFITGEDGLRAVEVAFAAYESSKTHQPVKIR